MYEEQKIKILTFTKAFRHTLFQHNDISSTYLKKSLLVIKILFNFST